MPLEERPRRSASGRLVVLAAVAAVVATPFAIRAILDSRAPVGGRTGSPRASAPVARYGDPQVVGRLQVPQLTELSGLTASRRNPGLLWAHNDSGDGPFLYCLEPSGAGCGTWRVEGARAVDWEDIAAGPGPNGEPALYVGDIGDNDRTRPNITIHRVHDPRIAPSGRGGGVLIPETFTFTYPDRPHDAEAIVVRPSTGDLYVITKNYSSKSLVFVARSPLAARQELQRVASIEMTGPLDAPTGASLAPTKDNIVFSSYGGGYELRLPDTERFDAIWEQPAVPVALGPHQQGEAVTYTISGTTIISASEGARSAIYAVERQD